MQDGQPGRGNLIRPATQEEILRLCSEQGMLESKIKPFIFYLMPIIYYLGFFAPATGEFLIDTIGWTNRDLQFAGPALRYLANDPLRGVHATYKNGYGEIRYNFKPKGEGWRWNEGFLINPYPRNLGCLDYNVNTGQALISADYLSRGQRFLSYFIDSLPGGAKFSERTFARGPQHNLIGTGQYGSPRFAAIWRDTLYYYSIIDLRKLGEIGPFPRHNLIAAKISTRLGYIWTNINTGELFLRETPNNGGTWYQTISLSAEVPSICNRSLFGANGVYDSIQLHLVADLYDGENRGRIQLWHYCPYDTPPWHFIYEYSLSDTTKLGRHTAAIDRPSIGIDRGEISADFNALYVVWEQFDETNIDPRTGIARADIWASHSSNNGKTWSSPIRLTIPDSTSKRFPFLAEVVNDTLHILYFADLIAGSWELGEGEMSQNPVIYLRVPANIFSAVSEERSPNPLPSSRRLPTFILNHNLNLNLSLYDPLGRRWSLGSTPANKLPTGVYLLVFNHPTATTIQPVIKLPRLASVLRR